MYLFNVLNYSDIKTNKQTQNSLPGSAKKKFKVSLLKLGKALETPKVRQEFGYGEF